MLLWFQIFRDNPFHLIAFSFSWLPYVRILIWKGSYSLHGLTNFDRRSSKITLYTCRSYDYILRFSLQVLCNVDRFCIERFQSIYYWRHCKFSANFWHHSSLPDSASFSHNRYRLWCHICIPWFILQNCWLKRLENSLVWDKFWCFYSFWHMICTWFTRTCFQDICYRWIAV